MYDINVAANIARSLQVKSQKIAFIENSLTPLVSTVPLQTPVENWKLPMQAFQLKDGNGSAAAGQSNTKPIYADLLIETKNPHEGVTLTRSDWVTYDFEKKINAFQQQIGSLDEFYTNAQVARLLVAGSTTKCSYDNQNFFSASPVHPILPTATKKFANSVNGSLTATPLANMTAKIALAAITKGLSNMRSRPQGRGGILGYLKPKAIVCHTQMEPFVLQALLGKFFDNSENVYGQLWKLDVLSSPYIDAEMDAAGITGDACNELYLLAAPNDDAAALVEGTYRPYELRTILGQVTITGQVDGFSLQYEGQIGYAHGLPQYATRIT